MTPENTPATPPARRPLIFALIFGFIFGFLLQKGGAAKYHILIGVLLLEDFTVIQIMVSAVIVGMIGVFTLHRFGVVQLHPKPTRYAANVVGGLIFGCGFALSAYCPGTAAAALGQGNFDALAVMAGMLCGSFAFAALSGWLNRTINPIGDRGHLILADLIPLPRLVTVFGLAALLAVFLYWLEVSF